MSKLAFLAPLLALFAGCAVHGQGAPPDGYAMFTQACNEHSKLESRDVYYEKGTEREVYCANGGSPSIDDVAWVAANAPVFALLETARANPVWNLPDNSTYSSETTFPSIAIWRSLSRAATIKAIIMVQEGDAREAIEFLGGLHEIGNKVNRKESLLHMLLQIASRGMQYPVLTSAVDALSTNELSACLSNAKSQYEQMPTIGECMIGEACMARNTAKGLFSGLRTNENFRAAWSNMIGELGSQGVDSQIIQQMRNEEILSISQWEAQTLCDLTNIQTYYESVLTTGAPSTFMVMQDELDARITAKCADMTLEKSMEMMNRFVSDTGTKSFSLPAAMALHDEIGSMVSWSYLGLMIPATGMYGLRYCEYLATERLLLIRMASRVYETEIGRAPESLQDLVTEGLLDNDMIEDPFSRRPFLVKRDQAGMAAYSVGRDLDDDGGTPWSSETRSGDGILVPLTSQQP